MEGCWSDKTQPVYINQCSKRLTIKLTKNKPFSSSSHLHAVGGGFDVEEPPDEDSLEDADHDDEDGVGRGPGVDHLIDGHQSLGILRSLRAQPPLLRSSLGESRPDLRYEGSNAGPDLRQVPP